MLVPVPKPGASGASLGGAGRMAGAASLIPKPSALAAMANWVCRNWPELAGWQRSKQQVFFSQYVHLKRGDGTCLRALLASILSPAVLPASTRV